MTIADKIRHGKLQYDINREGTKISTLSSGQVDKYKYLTGEKILSFDQSWMIEQTNLFSDRKSFRKRSKNNRRSRKKRNWSFKFFKTWSTNGK